MPRIPSRCCTYCCSNASRSSRSSAAASASSSSAAACCFSWSSIEAANSANAASLSFLSGLCATKGHKQSAGQTCMKGFGAVPLQAVLQLVTMEAARKTQQMLPPYLSCLACVPQKVTNTSRYIARQTCMRSIMPCHRRLPYVYRARYGAKKPLQLVGTRPYVTWCGTCALAQARPGLPYRPCCCCYSCCT